MTYEGAAAGDARRIIERYPAEHRRSAIMPLLYLAQSIEGTITDQALRDVAEMLGIRTAEVEAVASFYTMYRLRPTGRHVVNVCTNLACKLRGAQQVYAAAREAAGLSEGQEVSEDGLFTVHEEECLGSCDFAPVAQVNFASHHGVDAGRMRELIERLRGGDVPEPSVGSAFGSFKEASRALAGLELASEASE